MFIFILFASLCPLAYRPVGHCILAYFNCKSKPFLLYAPSIQTTLWKELCRVLGYSAQSHISFSLTASSLSLWALRYHSSPLPWPPLRNGRAEPCRPHNQAPLKPQSLKSAREGTGARLEICREGEPRVFLPFPLYHQQHFPQGPVSSLCRASLYTQAYSGIIFP